MQDLSIQRTLLRSARTVDDKGSGKTKAKLRAIVKDILGSLLCGFLFAPTAAFAHDFGLRGETAVH
jgi:hypothetical protein